MEYEKPFAEKYRPPPQKERTSPTDKKNEILMEPGLTDSTPILVDNPLLLSSTTSATTGQTNDRVSVQVFYVDDEGRVVNLDSASEANSGEAKSKKRSHDEMGEL